MPPIYLEAFFMASAAAIDGISRFGLGWKFRIKISDRMKEFGALKGQIESTSDAPRLKTALDKTILRLEGWHQWLTGEPGLTKYNDDDRKAIAEILEQLGAEIETLKDYDVADIDDVFEGDPDAFVDEVIGTFHEIMDTFDYYRVLAE